MRLSSPECVVIYNKYAEENPNQKGGKYFFTALPLFSVEVDCTGFPAPSTLSLLTLHCQLAIEKKQNWCAQGWTLGSNGGCKNLNLQRRWETITLPVDFLMSGVGGGERDTKLPQCKQCSVCRFCSLKFYILKQYYGYCWYSIYITLEHASF